MLCDGEGKKAEVGVLPRQGRPQGDSPPEGPGTVELGAKVLLGCQKRFLRAEGTGTDSGTCVLGGSESQSSFPCGPRVDQPPEGLEETLLRMGCCALGASWPQAMPAPRVQPCPSS